MERVNVIGRDTGAMADLVRVHGAAVVRQTLRQRDDGRWQVQALAEAADVASLEGAGFEVERLEDLGAAPGGLGRAAGGGAAEPGAPAPRAPIGYMDVAEVDRRLAALADRPHAGRTELLTLPYETWEGRSCYAVRIGPGAGPGRPGICLLGGVHAREWGSADILVVFAERLLAAYEGCKGIAIGRRRFSAALVRSLVDGANL